METTEDIKENLGVTRIIAFSGGTDADDGKVQSMISESVMRLAQYKVAILSGGTDWGVPRYAMQAAQRYKLPTIGVIPERGEKHTVGGIDKLIVVPSRIGQSEWGDESEYFVKLADGIEMIAGGNGTAIEFFRTMKINEGRLRKGGQPIYVAPIKGVGGFSEGIYGMNLAGYVKDSMPETQPTGAAEAVDFLVQKLLR
jgi:predicted Rossmann-fold nucleotide-binding protein